MIIIYYLLLYYYDYSDYYYYCYYFCIYIYIYIYIHNYVCMCVYVYIYIYIYTHNISISLSLSIYIYIYIYIYTYTYRAQRRGPQAGDPRTGAAQKKQSAMQFTTIFTISNYFQLFHNYSNNFQLFHTIPTISTIHNYFHKWGFDYNSTNSNFNGHVEFTQETLEFHPSGNMILFNRAESNPPCNSPLRPISALRFWISEGLTRAES